MRNGPRLSAPRGDAKAMAQPVFPATFPGLFVTFAHGQRLGLRRLLEREFGPA